MITKNDNIKYDYSTTKKNLDLIGASNFEKP